jgi:molybdenum cofactor cytidylyltransferase
LTKGHAVTRTLLAEVRGWPLVRIVVGEALHSRARSVIVITGHEREHVEAALVGLPVVFVNNPRFADGLGTLLTTGIAAVPTQSDGVIVCPGDAQIDAALIDRLINALSSPRWRLAHPDTVRSRLRSRAGPLPWRKYPNKRPHLPRSGFFS